MRKPGVHGYCHSFIPLLDNKDCAKERNTLLPFSVRRMQWLEMNFSSVKSVQFSCLAASLFASYTLASDCLV